MNNRPLASVSDTATQHRTAINLKNQRGAGRAIDAISFGNALAWYHFSFYALFALYIAKNFFHPQHGHSQLFEAFFTFKAPDVYSMIIYIPVYIQYIMHFASHQVLLAALTGNCFIMVCGIISRAWSYLISVQGIGIVRTRLFFIFSYPLLVLADHFHKIAMLIRAWCIRLFYLPFWLCLRYCGYAPVVPRCPCPNWLQPYTPAKPGSYYFAGNICLVL